MLSLLVVCIEAMDAARGWACHGRTCVESMVSSIISGYVALATLLVCDMLFVSHISSITRMTYRIQCTTCRRPKAKK